MSTRTGSSEHESDEDRFIGFRGIALTLLYSPISTVVPSMWQERVYKSLPRIPKLSPLETAIHSSSISIPLEGVASAVLVLLGTYAQIETGADWLSDIRPYLIPSRAGYSIVAYAFADTIVRIPFHDKRGMPSMVVEAAYYAARFAHSAYENLVKMVNTRNSQPNS